MFQREHKKGIGYCLERKLKSGQQSTVLVTASGERGRLKPAKAKQAGKAVSKIKVAGQQSIVLVTASSENQSSRTSKHIKVIVFIKRGH